METHSVWRDVGWHSGNTWRSRRRRDCCGCGSDYLRRSSHFIPTLILDRSSMAPGTSSMLRARRRDVNIKPNRLLDRNASRGMIYENEELRLRTININAEVEKGHHDIKKLRRENDQLRREIWNLRDEYDRLEALLKNKQEGTDEEEEEGDGEDSEEGETQEESGSQQEAGEQAQEVDVLSVVEEEPEDCADVSETPDRPKTVSFREETLQVPGGQSRMESVVKEPNASSIPGPQLPVPGQLDFPGLHPNLQSLLDSHLPEKVYSPGGSEVVTTAILQRRQSYTHNGDQTKDTFTCAASRQTTVASGGYPCTTFPAMDPPSFRTPGTQCEPYSGPAPSFLRLNSVQPYTVVFSVIDPQFMNLSVQEVIDEMSAQLSAALMHSLRGVRLVGGSCYLSFSAQQDADTCRALPLTLRGTSLLLEDVAAGTSVLSLSGVPHNATDDDVIAVLGAFGSVLGPVERRVYKGVDTGERVVRMRLRLAVPQWVWLDDCRVYIKLIRSEEVTNLSLSRRKSFRSHISVQLMPVSEDSPPIPPLPSSTKCPVGPTVSSSIPFTSGSTPSIPVIPNSTESQASFLSGASASTPNIFQETPFIFPQPQKKVDPPGLRRINSVMGTMSLGDTEDPQTRSASSPPTATLSARNAISDGEVPRQITTQHSPTTTRKVTQRHKASRKVSKSNTDPRKVNGETSSSDQDSPQKPGRRRPSSVYFKRPGPGILNHSVSVDQTDGTGYEATCSERERSNSDISSRLSICKRKMSTTGRESGKVPWCGCWGNGCI